MDKRDEAGKKGVRKTGAAASKPAAQPKQQRPRGEKWVKKAAMSDVAGNEAGFASDDAAVIAFLKKHQAASQRDRKEYGVVVYEKDGRYHLGETHVGDEGSVVKIFVESALLSAGLGRVVGTVHTHPEEYDSFGTNSRNNSFSGMDELLPGIRWLGAPNGAVYRNDKSGRPNRIVCRDLPKTPESIRAQEIYGNVKLLPELGKRISTKVSGVIGTLKKK